MEIMKYETLKYFQVGKYNEKIRCIFCEIYDNTNSSICEKCKREREWRCKKCNKYYICTNGTVAEDHKDKFYLCNFCQEF